jgi:hypothetical protein
MELTNKLIELFGTEPFGKGNIGHGNIFLQS